MANLYLKQSTAYTLHLGPFVDAADGYTLETGLTPAAGDVLVSKNNGVPAAKTEATAPVHVAGGYYSVLIDATDTGTTGNFVIACNFSGARPMRFEYRIGTGDAPSANVIEIDGQDTSGNNATLYLKQLNVVNSAGSAIVATSSGGNGHGAIFTGNGNGEGASFNGGTTGSGADFIGGATGGHGIRTVAGTGSGGSGLSVTGDGSGAGCQIDGGSTGNGALIRSGASSGIGVRIQARAGSAGHGLRIDGDGVGSAVYAISGTGAAAIGVQIISQAASGAGHGLAITGVQSGNGLNAVASGSGADISGDITGNITGNLVGNVNGDVTGVVSSGTFTGTVS